MLGLCQTGEVLARYLDPDAFGHLALARVLLDQRAERFSDLRSDLQRRRQHDLRSRYYRTTFLCLPTSAKMGDDLQSLGD